MTCTGSCQALLGAWLALLLGVVRYKHCVNSSIHSADSFLAASAARGKLRRDGRRPPLSWCAPCDGLSGDLTHVLKVLKIFSLPECGLPHLNGRCLDDLSVSMPPKKMSMGRFHQLGRLIFVQLLEWTEEQASRLSSRSATRTLPTAADTVGLSASDRASLGGSSGTSSAESVAEAARYFKMLLRYSRARVTTSFVVKAHLIAVYKRAFLHGQAPEEDWSQVAVAYPQLIGLRTAQRPLASSPPPTQNLDPEKNMLQQLGRQMPSLKTRSFDDFSLIGNHTWFHSLSVSDCSMSSVGFASSSLPNPPCPCSLWSRCESG